MTDPGTDGAQVQLGDSIGDIYVSVANSKVTSWEATPSLDHGL